MGFCVCKAPNAGLGTPTVNEVKSIKYRETRPKYKKLKCRNETTVHTSYYQLVKQTLHSEKRVYFDNSINTNLVNTYCFLGTVLH